MCGGGVGRREPEINGLVVCWKLMRACIVTVSFENEVNKEEVVPIPFVKV
jgi:hypothetical protein